MFDSIPTRRELVKEAARNLNVTELREKQKEHLAHRWSQCPVSHKALAPPIVADYSGDLYNKDAILQYLLPAEVSPLDKTEAEKFIQGRVKSLKDVVEVKFEIEKDDVLKTEKWVCPVTGKELGLNVKAVYLVPCGHAFSQEAVREVKSDTCSVCATKFEERNVVPILPSTDADKLFVLERMETLKAEGLAHSLKKVKGEKKRKANGEIKTEIKHENGDNVGNGTTQRKTGEDIKRTDTPQSGISTPKIESNINHGATASLTAKVLAEEAAKKKRRLMAGENENIQSLYRKEGNGKVRDGEFMTRGFSIAANDKR